MRSVVAVQIVCLLGSFSVAQETMRLLTPAEARTKVDQKVTVAMEVKSTGGKTARYLNSETDFRTDKNFAVFIPNVALDAFKKAGIEDPGKHYFGKTIVVSGTVALSQSRPEIRVENPGQIKVVNGAAEPPAAVKRPGK
jgi:hypothetical protein